MFKTIKHVLIILIYLSCSLIFSQDDFSDEVAVSDQFTSVSGQITDSKTGRAIAGANVMVEGGDIGAAADENGNYQIDNIEQGVSITASAIGYDDLTVFADSAELNFSLSQKVLELGALDVIAPKAKFRETPVAFSDVSKEELELRLGSRDLSL